VFLSFVSRQGWQLADFLEDESWKERGDERWQALGQDRSWVERVIAICQERGLREASGSEGEEEWARLITSSIPREHTLIITAKNVDRRLKLYRVVLDVGRVLACTTAVNAREQQSRVRELAEEYLKEAGKSLTAEAWEQLGARTGFDLRESLAEIEKLIIYTGSRPSITEADIDALVGKTKEESVFRLTGALARKDGRTALLVLNELFNHATPPPMIVSLLARELGLLLRAQLLLRDVPLWQETMDAGTFQRRVFPKLREASRELGALNPFIAYQVAKNASAFTVDELAQALSSLSQVDRAIKSTGQNPRLLLERFVIQTTA